MDLKKAYGVEKAIGSAIVQHSLEDGLRKVQTPEEFRKFIESVPTPLSREMLTQWAQGIEDAEWKKARSKLLLGAQTASGKIRERTDDEAEHHGVSRAPR